MQYSVSKTKIYNNQTLIQNDKTTTTNPSVYQVILGWTVDPWTLFLHLFWNRNCGNN